MSQLTSITKNIKQNAEDFELDPLELQAPIFRLKYLKKELKKRKSNPELLENYRTVTVTYLMPSCNMKWTNQAVNRSTSNYLSHFRYSHKSINLNSIQTGISQEEITDSSQQSLKQSFSSQQSSVSIRPQAFTITHFKRLLLNFIISNNISFYAITT
ncbi:hypothetical protein DL95DRAFT_399152, partial [Leptodontidium sp. 2 PMI_412]